jgi:hypothetical protein
MRKPKIGRDRIIGGLLAGFSIVMLLWGIPVGVEKMGGEVGPGLDPTFMPRLIVILIGGLAVLLMVSREPHQEDRLLLFPIRTVVTILFFAIYMGLTPIIGYLPASLVILPGYLLYFGARNWRVVVPLSILLPIGLYLFFAKVMLVMLPPGIFLE